VYWKGVVAELYWFMSGQTNIKYLVDNNVHIWDDYPYKYYLRAVKAHSASSGQAKKVPFLTKDEFIQQIKEDTAFAKTWGELPKIYGEMWRHWPTRSARSTRSGQARTIDQLAWVMKEMKDDPDAKNLIVTSWNPEYLYTMADHEDASLFPICHNMYQISNRNGKLSLQLYQRSADMFLGVPFNIASYALLVHVLAHVSGLEVGEFVHTFGDVHIYDNHVEQVKEQLKREPRPFPTIKIDPSVKTIDDFRPELVTLENYDPHPMLKGELTVAGGLFDPKTGKMAE
jgi:thymidylate synthase